MRKLASPGLARMPLSRAPEFRVPDTRASEFKAPKLQGLINHCSGFGQALSAVAVGLATDHGRQPRVEGGDPDTLFS